MTSATELLLPGGEKAGMRGSGGGAVASHPDRRTPSPNPLPEGEGFSSRTLVGISLEGSVG